VSLMGLMSVEVHTRRIISGFYLFASIEMLLCCIAFMVFPRSRAILDPGFIVPDFFAELATALWFAVKGVKLPATHASIRLAS
jgi:hypothetical protein